MFHLNPLPANATKPWNIKFRMLMPKGVSSWVRPIKIEILYETQLVESLELHVC